MVNVIFCAHGQLACAMLDSVRMVYGDVKASAVAFMPGENAGDIATRLDELVSAHNDSEWLIAVDLQCGSPWNAAAGLAMKTRDCGSSAVSLYRWRWNWWITSRP